MCVCVCVCVESWINETLKTGLEARCFGLLFHFQELSQTEPFSEFFYV